MESDATGAAYRAVHPYRVATLLYAFNEADEALLIHRRFPPNEGLWSPSGGKLRTEHGESPYAAACREGGEELGLELVPASLHLTGLISEHGYMGQSHWLIFMFEIGQRLQTLPPPHREGTFGFFSREALGPLPLPETDREFLWPHFWKHRGGFFAAHCHWDAAGNHRWELEQSIQAHGGRPA